MKRMEEQRPVKKGIYRRSIEVRTMVQMKEMQLCERKPV
jgi:hypothetical protein